MPLSFLDPAIMSQVASNCVNCLGQQPLICKASYLFHMLQLEKDGKATDKTCRPKHPAVPPTASDRAAVNSQPQ